MLSLDDTICAVASASGGAVRGIVRMSGPGVAGVLHGAFRSRTGSPLADVRTATAIPGTLEVAPPIGPLPGELFFWPTARSYTAQPTAEFHTFGSPPLLSAVLRTCCQHGARLAEPGEFTMRAFLAGRLDLTQAEAVLGVIDANNNMRLNAALNQLAGGMSRPLARLREQLLQLLAHLEAGLDFVDEDIEFISPAELDRSLTTAAGEVAELLERLGKRTTAGECPKVVLHGAPNVGKSSLFNALIGEQSAIVSQIPGTTRDYLSARLDLTGVTCELHDTAGLSDDPQSAIDGLAQQVTVDLIGTADVVVACFDRHDLKSTAPHAGHATVIPVLTKCDLAAATPATHGWLATSSVTGRGLDELRQQIRAAVARLAEDSPVASTAERCYDSLRLADTSLASARALNLSRAGEELIAAELRVALTELGKVAGAVYTDDILDRIFSRFCIGK